MRYLPGQGKIGRSNSFAGDRISVLGNHLGRSQIFLLSAIICDRADVQAGAQRQRVS
ncbi:MAG: hypothetical protein AB4352_05855 [Hormoscilla sp.]